MLNKASALKAVLLIVILFIIITLLNTRQNNNKHEAFYFKHRVDYEYDNSVYTVFTDSNSTLKKINYKIENISEHSNNFNKKRTDFEKILFPVNNNGLNVIPINGKVLNKDNNNNNNNNKICPQVPQNLNGPILPDVKYELLEDIEKKLSNIILPGGFYSPKDCNAKYHVAIIVPFRDRYTHLPIFLKNLHPFLINQNIEYEIFIIEQTNGKPFNRAALMNIGFLESNKFKKWDCFIFHDVDLLPLDDRNFYNCPDKTSCRHHSVAIDVFGYKLPYNSIFGGVSSLNYEQFKTINGFSNSFWGWGGEDDDMYNRLIHANYYISRYPINIARYVMLNHKKEKANPKRYKNLAFGSKRFSIDGLNSIQYDVYSIKKLPLFTWILVEIKLNEQST